MLDDLKLIHERDAQDALGAVGKQWQHLQYSFVPTGNTSFEGVQNIVYAAMGGSALAASLVQSWPGATKPMEIVRGYDLPSYVGADTLVVAASYSGNTEETLSAIEQAEAKGAKIAVITAGGGLQQLAEEKGYMLMLLPKAELPRCATFYNFRALLQVLDAAGVLQSVDYAAAFEKTSAFIKEAAEKWAPDVATASNPAKQLAQELMGKSIVMYSGPKMHPAAYKWKLGFNENAKQVAWINQLPEFNHNEFTGWSKQPVDKPYAVIDLRSNLENPRVQKRFEVTARLLSGMRPEPIVIQAEGNNELEQLVWSIVFGDYVGLYLALLNRINPTPLELVDKLKSALSE
jgi:glucose/mannose-6-phosphate isomerase